MNVKIIRLLTGDDILGEVIDSGYENKTEIKNPMLIGITPEQTLATAPLSLVAKTETVTISNNHILFIADPEDNILDSYKEKFGGIITSSNLII
jgi:hypothetical protein